MSDQEEEEEDVFAKQVARAISKGLQEALKENQKASASALKEAQRANEQVLSESRQANKIALKEAHQASALMMEAMQKQNDDLASLNQTLVTQVDDLSKVLQRSTLTGFGSTTGHGTTSVLGGSGLSTTVTSSKETPTTTLSVCDGLAWKNFRSNFELVNELNGWKDDRAILKMRTAMREDAHRAIEHLSFDPQTTITEALDKVENVFINPSSLDLAEAKFEAACREPGETLQAWHIRVRELYMRAFPFEKDVEKQKRLKDKFILKCRDQRLTLWVRDKEGYRDFTYTEVLTKAQDHEGNVSSTALAYEGRRNRHIQEVNSTEMGFIQEISPNEEEDDKEDLANLTDARIHQLSAFLHKTEPFPLKKNENKSSGGCFHCGETGHMIRACKLFTDAVQRIKRQPGMYGLALAASSAQGQFRSRGGFRGGNFRGGNFRGRRGTSGRGRGGYNNNFRGKGRGGRGGGNHHIQEIKESEVLSDIVEDEEPYYDQDDSYSGN